MGKTQAKPEKPVVHFESRDEFRRWLADHFDDEVGIWLKLAKKSGEVPAPNYDEALEVALCFGWIDGQVRRFDEHVYLQSFTPRRKRSPWSKRNVGLASELIENGRMEPRGFAEVERAKQDGRWDRAYEGAAGYEPHPDFMAELRKNPVALENYERLNSVGRYAIYFRIHDAKRADTRRRRIRKYVDLLADGESPV